MENGPTKANAPSLLALIEEEGDSGEDTISDNEIIAYVGGILKMGLPSADQDPSYGSSGQDPEKFKIRKKGLEQESSYPNDKAKFDRDRGKA